MSLTAQEIQLIKDSGLFDAAWYAEKYPDVGIVGLDPLDHFLRIGIHAGREPGPLFDSKHYRRQLEQFDSGRNAGIPLCDYLQQGWREGINPNPFFDVSFYLEQSPDVSNAGMEPLGHFIRFGSFEKRNPHPIFDIAFYLGKNPDVAHSGVGPLQHFILNGLHEGREPNAYFNSKEYLLQNPDVAHSGAPATLHYVINGQKEKRKINISRSKILNASITRNSNGQYKIIEGSSGYVYIEPSKPENLDLHLQKLKAKPKFSIIVPVYNTTHELLHAAVDSVIAQWYKNWNLIIVNDASPLQSTKRVVDAIQHPKITKINLDQNLGISGATNEGLKNADGDFIVFLDHDDTLTVDCLYELVLCINNENPDYIYSDEDKLAPDGNYVEPHFKPSWSPDTMMSTMYTCHVSCVKKSILDSVGLLCSEYDGCQDWDFVLRVTEKTNRISHIPKVLYHWRIIPESIASDINAKPYAVDVSRRVREAALKRRGVDGSVEKVPNLSGYYNVNYKIHGEPRISIIIPSRDNKALLKNCIDSIFDKTIYQNYELVIIDNGSLDRDTINFLNSLKKHNNILVIKDDSQFNYSKLNNIGVEKSTGDFLLFLNDDTEVISGEWLTRLASFAQLSHVGAVGAQLLYPNNTSIQHAGILNLEDGPGHAFLNQNCNIPGYFGRNLLDCNFVAVTGACLMIQRKKFIQIAGFDESFPVAYNDIDLCFRLLDKNYYNVVVQGVQLIHHESSSRGIDHLDKEKMERLKNEKAKLYQKNSSYFQYDPFYNINLHPNGINYELVN